MMVDSLDIELTSEPVSARRARGELERFRDFLGDTRFEDLRLLISELVGEAIGGLGKSHGDLIHLRAECDDDRVRASVEDPTSAFLVPSARPEPGEVGWSIYLVQRVSDCWGLRRDRQGATVWLEILPGSEARPQSARGLSR
jgi:hypothetical protein